MELAYPWFLVLLPLLALVVWWSLRHSLAGMSPVQRRWCVAIRSLLLLCAVLAMVSPRLLLPARGVAVAYVLDDSASVSASAAQQARAWIADSYSHRGASDSAAVVGFAREAAVWHPFTGGTLDPAKWPALEDRAATDVPAGLDMALASLPPYGARRVVLLGDGNDTSDGAALAVQRLAESGIEVWTVPMANPAAPEVLVERVDIPRRVRTGEPFNLVAAIRSNVATAAKVKLYQNQFLLEQRDMDLREGSNAFTAAGMQVEGSFSSFEVEVLPALDTAVENNRAVAGTSSRGEPKVLLVDAEEPQTRPLAEALRREKIQVDTRASQGAPRTLDDLQQYDLLMLSDVSALRLGREQMELYRRWVQDFGGGFILLGGEQSYGVGGYYRTPVEQMLPVRMEHEDRQDTPSVALLVVLDRSGSMTAQVQGQTKMSLANQGAVFAMAALQPRDYFGVLAVDTRAHTVAPLAQLAAREGAEQKIMSITAGGGGIYIYTSLAEAFALLRDAPARIKHLILFSDSADAEEKIAGEMGDGAKAGGSSLDLATAMLSARITTSVVALGGEQDKDTSFLRQLAERGNGRFYLTSDATTLPQIFSTETMKVAQSSLIEEPSQALPVGTHSMIGGIDWAQSPPLLGYNTTKPKPTADILLATERGDPLLVVWRYGLGQSAAFTSDAKSRWAAEWLGWPGYGKLWAQLVRGLMRRSDQATFQVNTDEQGDRLSLEIDAASADGGFRNRLPIKVTALQPDGQTESGDAVQVAPGRYTRTIRLPPEGTTVISVSSPELPDGGLSFGHTRSYPREFLRTDTDEEALRSLAVLGGGRFAPQPREVFSPARTSAPYRQDLTSAFLIAALCLLPLDIWLRRRGWT